MNVCYYFSAHTVTSVGLCGLCGTTSQTCVMTMYLKNCLYVFAVICITTFILNYTVLKNLDFGGIRQTIELVRPPSEDLLDILQYRKNKSVNDSSSNSDFKNSDYLQYGAERAHLNTSFFNCTQSDIVRARSKTSETVIHNAYTFLINFSPASRTFGCNESITYTTHGEFRYLDNLVPLVERWEGPISIALYAPGNDIEETVRRIHFLRECTTDLIKELVTFHIFFDTKFQKETPLPSQDALKKPIDCLSVPSFSDDVQSYRRDKHLTYPVNVARNLARNQSSTYFVLPSDIELYPSLNIIPLFLDMVARQELINSLDITPETEKKANPRIYVLPIFEVEEGYAIPDTKEDLKRLLKNSLAVPFHKYVCPECHKVPKYNSWLKAKYIPNQINVFHTAKRKRPYQFWEPIYIGTNQDPLYDERLSWEGLRDKMSQGFVLCILDYDFMIMDNAFLVHRPGIKKKKRNKKPTLAIRRQNRLLTSKIQREIIKTYGKRNGCFI